MLGPDAAATLMEHLPPTTWGDMATRSDLDVAKAELKGQFHAEMASQTRTLVFTVIASNLAMAGATLASALAR